MAPCPVLGPAPWTSAALPSTRLSHSGICDQPALPPHSDRNPPQQPTATGSRGQRGSKQQSDQPVPSEGAQEWREPGGPSRLGLPRARLRCSVRPALSDEPGKRAVVLLPLCYFKSQSQGRDVSPVATRLVRSGACRTPSDPGHLPSVRLCAPRTYSSIALVDACLLSMFLGIQK